MYVSFHIFYVCKFLCTFSQKEPFHPFKNLSALFLLYNITIVPPRFIPRQTMTIFGIEDLHYVYRDDGTLYYRDYTHNPMIFGTTFCSLESYYDKSGRVVYESGYITHGRLEYYYIYKDEGDKPEYLLEIDYNGGYVIPHIKCYY